MRLSRGAVRFGIVAALVAPACIIVLATNLRAQIRPPTPGGLPQPPGLGPKFPGGGLNPPGGGPKLPGGGPQLPGGGLNPPGGKVIEMVWTCGKCRKDVGRGIRPPASCPHCGVKFINGTDNTFLNGGAGGPPVGGNPPIGQQPIGGGPILNPPVGNPPINNPPIGNPPVNNPPIAMLPGDAVAPIGVPVNVDGNPIEKPVQPQEKGEPAAPKGDDRPAANAKAPPDNRPQAEPAPLRPRADGASVGVIVLVVGAVFVSLLALFCAGGALVFCFVIKGKKEAERP